MNSHHKLMPALVVGGLLISPLHAPAQTQQPQTQQNSTPPIIVEADQSIQWHRDQKQYIATGRASAQRGQLRLTADVIIADYKTENNDQNTSITHVRGQENATFSDANIVATAHNISYDINAEIITMHGGTPSLNDGERTLKADASITYNRLSRELVAKGGAHITLKNGQQLLGQNINALINDNETNIDRLTVTGNVVFIDPNHERKQRAEANHLTYTPQTGRAILNGNVRLTENDSTLTGDKAEINTIKGDSTVSSSQDGKRVSGTFIPPAE